MAIISTNTFDFLLDIKENNHKPWFDKNKTRYQTSHQEMIAFADALLERMNEIDRIETPTGKKSLMRIYRDVRFSKNKLPYKIHWGGGFRRLGKDRRGGFYYHIEPGASFIGGGFWSPSSADLLLLRKHIEVEAEELREILTEDEFIHYFGGLEGDQVKTAPKGFKRDHPNIDLLRYKQFLIRHSFSDEEVLSKDFVNQVADGFKRMLPFFQLMTAFLTTDLNGEPLG